MAINESKEEETFTHPSFGQIRFSRANGHADFYGSELSQDNYITMEIVQSEIQRTLTGDRYFGHASPIVKLRMTANQFS